MNESLAGRNIRGSNFRHVVSWIISTLLIDSTVFTNRATLLVIGHFDQTGAFEVIRGNNVIDRMEQENIS